MSDYISRQAAIEVVAKWLNDALGIVEKDGQPTVIKRLRKLPTADVVEVVRCKDCKHRRTNDLGDTWCNYHGIEMLEDDYCNYGERAKE